MEKAGTEALLCPFPSIWTWMSASCGVCSASPPCHPAEPTFPSSQASPVLARGLGHQTPAHHGQTSPGMEEGALNPELLADNPRGSSAAAGGLLRDTGVSPPALSQGQRRRRHPHPRSRGILLLKPQSWAVSAACALQQPPHGRKEPVSWEQPPREGRARRHAVMEQSLTFVVVSSQPLGTCKKPSRVSGIPSALPGLPSSGEGKGGWAEPLPGFKAGAVPFPRESLLMSWGLVSSW